MNQAKHPGLSTTEAAARRSRFGLNEIVGQRRWQPIVALVSKLNNPLLWIILAAAAVSYFTGEPTNAVILLAMVLLSVLLDFLNTFRSARAIDSLRARVRTMVHVRRDDHDQVIPIEHIVPGDIVTLTAGNVIPADGYVVDSKDLHVNESTLTGESWPVGKDVVPGATPDQLYHDRPDAVFMGTSVITGYAIMVVIQTGRQTRYGQIAARLVSKDGQTDFEKQLRSFSMFLMRVTVIMVLAVLLINLVADRGIFTSILFAIAVAIGLTPELLPVIMAVSLSRGAVRMARQKVIVKQLPAIQNLGRMNVLCTDKTGTLTENRISVVKYLNAEGETDESVLRQAYLSSKMHSGVYSALDEAIAGSRQWSLSQVEKVDEEPFDFERRRESIIVSEGGQYRLIVKGAPEAVMNVCASVRGSGGAEPWSAAVEQKLLRLYDDLSRDGYKIIAVAGRDLPAERREYEPNDEQGMVFFGFIALFDPPKASARQAIDNLERLGVTVKILTGDSLQLTEKICRDIDVPVRGAITGQELSRLPDSEWPRVVQDRTIFARIDPVQKEKIIHLLRHSGNVVGYLGDGINDAPALKAADVGISVNNAVDVAKDTADVILLEQSLDVLRNGVIEGRKTFQNTMKYILMALSSNFGNMFSMVLASGFLPFLPMLPTQILLNNFLYDSSQLALASDQVDRQDLSQPARWDLGFIRRFMLVFGPLSSLFDILTFVVLLSWFALPEASFQTGWFMESIATQVLVIYIIRTRRTPFLQSRPGKWLLLNTVVVATVAWVLPITPWGQAFGFVQLPARVVATMAGMTIAYLVVIEIFKRAFYRHEALRRERAPILHAQST